MDRKNNEGGSKASNPIDAAANSEEDVFILDDFGMLGQQSPDAVDKSVSKLLSNAASQGAEGSDELMIVDGVDEGEPAMAGAARAASAVPALGPEPEEVQLGASEGEVAAVEPPAEAIKEEVPSLEPEPVAADSAEEDAPASRFPRWIPIAAAAAVVLGIGGTLWFTLLAPQTTPSETTEVAAVPTNTTATPKKAPTPIVRKPVLNPDSVPPDLGAANPNNTPVDPTPTTGSNPEVTPTDPNVQPADPSNPTPSGNGESMDPTKANDPAGTGANTPANQATNPNDTPPVERAGQPTLASLARGTDVIVRLRNGNLFNGKLDRFTPEEARLRVPKGIIEFSVRDVDAIVPLSQASKKAGPQAVIQLLNGNKLAGRLTDDTADQVTLAVGAAEIIVPKSAIASLELRSPLGLVLGDEPPKPAPTPK